MFGCIAWLPNETNNNKTLAALSFGEMEETTRTLSYYVDEDYLAGPEIQYPLPKWSNRCGSEVSTVETNVNSDLWATAEKDKPHTILPVDSP